MTFEELFYELKPFLCLAGAIFALCLKDPPPLVIVAAMMLLTAGAWILRARWKVRGKGSELETKFYEIQPYLFIGLGVFAIAIEKTSKITVAFSLVLMACAAIILRWRKQ